MITNLGGCSVGSYNAGRAFLAETMFSFFSLFIAFGTALDPGQREIYGPLLGPFFVSITLALVIFIGGGLEAGWTGPSMNPARCFGPAIAMSNEALYGKLWVFMLGPMIAAVPIAVLYRTIPPNTHVLYEQKQQRRLQMQQQPASVAELQLKQTQQQ